MAGVFVIGSINQDFMLEVERRLESGETVTDAELSLFPGGKVGWGMAVRIEKVLYAVLHETHKQQVEDTMQTLGE